MNDVNETVQDLIARVDQLESRIAIRDLVSDYCHGFDKRDYERFLAIWWEDCVWNVGPPFGTFEGHAGIHSAIHEVLWPAWGDSHHLTTNLRIDFVDADNANAVCDVDCTGNLTGETVCQIISATYTDKLTRRGTQWRILQRDVKIHYFNPIPGTTLSAPA